MNTTSWKPALPLIKYAMLLFILAFLVNPGFGDPICMDKVMMVNEIKYDERIKCHHSHSKSCFDTFITTYASVTEQECSDEYNKRCDIHYNKVARDHNVEICHQPLERNCDLPGETICTNESESVCETIFKEFEVDEDVPDCRNIVEERCMTMEETGENVCQDVERQVCDVNKKTKKKLKPNTKCRLVPRRVCGPSTCPLAVGEDICTTETRTLLEDEPHEECDLVPQRVCKDISRLVPRLIPKKKCVDVPREVCVRLRSNPRTVKVPVVKEWCTDEEDSDLINKRR